MRDQAQIFFEGRLVAPAVWTGERWLLLSPDPDFLSALPPEVVVCAETRVRAQIETDAGSIYAREIPDL